MDGMDEADTNIMDSSGAGIGSTDLPNYTEDTATIRSFLEEHTILLPLDQSCLFDSTSNHNNSTDDSLLEEPTHPGMHRCAIYKPILQKIKNRSYKTTVSPIIELPLDELVIWDAIRGGDLGLNIVKNTMQYRNLISQVIDEMLESLVVSDAGGGIVRDAMDILADQRMTNQRNNNAGNEGENERNIEDREDVLGLDSAATSNQNQNQQQNLEGDTFPPLLMRRYELRILPKGRVFTCFESTASNTIASVPSLSIRQIRSEVMGHLITITGMIVRVSDVKPICVVATYTCETCGSEVYQEVSSQRSFLPLRKCPIPNCPSLKSEETLFLQTRGSKFWKFQEWKIQELPGQVPKGCIPRSMPIHVRGELTRLVSPGDVITVDGVVLPLKTNDSFYAAIQSGLVTSTYLEAFHCMVHKRSFDSVLAQQSSLLADRSLDAIANSDDPLLTLSSSIAPEIFGHEDIKKALLLQLVGGVEQRLPDGMRIRGDINICLMGDPGVAKSQLLKHVGTISPRGVYTTGRGSSGVGLTAAITRDNLTKEMALEGGALVLADKGICCIDEFDKMEEADRSAIHEVMEQQTVSIAKAGIVATLNARAAVLAAANPLYGRYNKRKSLSENINLPNSLLSRFDLLFLVLDRVDMTRDMALARHVTLVHKEGEDAGAGTDNINASSSNNSNTNNNTTNDVQKVPTALLRQYISKARKYNPTIPPDVAPYLVEAYVGLRQSQQTSRQPQHDQTVMTPRQLLSILRIAQALARLRFTQLVAREDVDEAIRLIHCSKSSLTEDDENHLSNNSNSNSNTAQSTDVMSRIFNMIRDYASLLKTNTKTTASSATAETQPRVSIQVLEAMVIQKGFTKEQLMACLEEYESLLILCVNNARTHVEFLGDV